MVKPLGAATFQEFIGERSSSWYQKAKGKLREWRDNRTGKPVADMYYAGHEPRVQFPRLALPYIAMYETLYMCAPARTIVNHLIEETFRNRGRWKERFAVKCGVCKLQMEHYPKDGMCERASCKSNVMWDQDSPGIFGISPDDDELAYANEKFARVNNAGESLWEVLRQCALDLCVADDAYLIAVKTYQRWPDGRVTAKLEELVRGHPNVVRIVSDDYGNRGGLYYMCPMHKSSVYSRPGMGSSSNTNIPNVAQDQGTYEGWYVPAESAPDACPVKLQNGKQCGLAMKNVWYVATDSGGAAPKQYYFEDECIHLSYYTPSVLYGISPTLTLYREERSLIKMAEYVQAYFEKRRIPRGVVAVNTPRVENIIPLKQEFNKQADDSQHDIPFVAVEGSNARGWIEFIPFADKLNEMDLQNLRDEFRQVIGAFYGVSPVFQGDMSQGGGLNNEGLQITVTNRSIEAFQSLFNEKVFPWLAGQFDITDHKFVLNNSEEKDLAHVHQLELLKLQTAQLKMQMGLKFLGVDENGDYKFEDKPTRGHPAMQPFEQAELMAQGLQPPQQEGVDPQAQATQLPGGTQPGAQQQAAMPHDEMDKATDEAASRLHGAPADVDGRGEVSV